MHRTFKSTVFLFLLMTSVACEVTWGAGTKMDNSWADPEAGPIDFEKILVVFIHESPGVRRTIEDAIVDYLYPTEAIASYVEIGEDVLENEERTKAKVKQAGFDGAVVMRKVGENQKLNYSPGMYYPTPYMSFWGYYGGYSGYGWAYQPGMVMTDSFVYVETNIYSLTDDKLIWSGLTESLNPKDAPKMLKQVLKNVNKALRREGL